MSLTAKQSKFVASYQLTGNPRESAINAGYSVKSAPEIACRLVKNPKIIAQIDQWKAKKSQELTQADFVTKALRDYEDTPLIEANRPRFLQLAGQGAGIIGSQNDSRPTQTNNIQINISGHESAAELWSAARKLLSNE